MHIKTEPTVTVRLYMAGDIDQAKQLLRREVFPPNAGLCVTVGPTTFIYTGGEEAGFVVGFVNYPRFPTTPDVLLLRAKVVAAALLDGLCLWSALLVTPTETVWLTNRPEDNQ